MNQLQPTPKHKLTDQSLNLRSSDLTIEALNAFKIQQQSRNLNIFAERIVYELYNELRHTDQSVTKWFQFLYRLKESIGHAHWLIVDQTDDYSLDKNEVPTSAQYTGGAIHCLNNAMHTLRNTTDPIDAICATIPDVQRAENLVLNLYNFYNSNDQRFKQFEDYVSEHEQPVKYELARVEAVLKIFESLLVNSDDTEACTWESQNLVFTLLSTSTPYRKNPYLRPIIDYHHILLRYMPSGRDRHYMVKRLRFLKELFRN